MIGSESFSISHLQSGQLNLRSLLKGLVQKLWSILFQSQPGGQTGVWFKCQLYTGLSGHFGGYLRYTPANDEHNLLDDDGAQHMEYFTRSMDSSPDRAAVETPGPLLKRNAAPWHAGTVFVNMIYMHTCGCKPAWNTNNFPSGLFWFPLQTIQHESSIFYRKWSKTQCDLGWNTSWVPSFVLSRVPLYLRTVVMQLLVRLVNWVKHLIWSLLLTGSWFDHMVFWTIVFGLPGLRSHVAKS